jgi:uncharacterized protein (DUF1810 family)
VPPEDPFDLARFVQAQDPVFASVEAELRAGRKRTHWMWFVFPQLRDLGRSNTAKFFGITSLDEAKAYFAHPVLGPRLTVCTNLVLAIKDASLTQIFGTPDDLKLHSSMTLFALAAGQTEGIFDQALQRYCAGKRDEQTLALVTPSGAP